MEMAEGEEEREYSCKLLMKGPKEAFITLVPSDYEEKIIYETDKKNFNLSSLVFKNKKWGFYERLQEVMEDLATVLESKEKLYTLTWAKKKIKEKVNGKFQFKKDANGDPIKMITKNKLWLSISIPINKRETKLKFVLIKRKEDLTTEEQNKFLITENKMLLVELEQIKKEWEEMEKIKNNIIGPEEKFSEDKDQIENQSDEDDEEESQNYDEEKSELKFLQSVKNPVILKYQNLKCWGCGENNKYDMWICKNEAKDASQDNDKTRDGYSALCKLKACQNLVRKSKYVYSFVKNIAKQGELNAEQIEANQQLPCSECEETKPGQMTIYFNEKENQYQAYCQKPICNKEENFVKLKLIGVPENFDMLGTVISH